VSAGAPPRRRWPPTDPSLGGDRWVDHPADRRRDYGLSRPRQESHGPDPALPYALEVMTGPYKEVEQYANSSLQRTEYQPATVPLRTATSMTCALKRTRLQALRLCLMQSRLHGLRCSLVPYFICIGTTMPPFNALDLPPDAHIPCIWIHVLPTKSYGCFPWSGRADNSWVYT
jgi:hypothetical protein